MRYEARLDTAGLHVPQFLYAQAVRLRIDVREIFFLHQVFCQRSTRSFGQYRYFGAKFVSRRKIGFRLAVFIYALIFGDYAGDSLALVDQRSSAKLRKKTYACSFHEPAHPFHNFVEGNNVIALVFEWRRSQWEANGRILGKK